MKLKKILLGIIVTCLVFFPIQNLVQAKTETAYVIPVKGVIDLGLTKFVQSSIDEAEKNEAKVIVFDIDTPGGEVSAAVELSNKILATKIPTISFINNEATSAGVILAISSDDIFAVARATIGAAETRPKEEKYISYWSSKLRNAAELTGRDPKLVAAMADADIVIEGVKEKGKILSLTTSEALKLGLVDKEVSDINELIKEVALSGKLDELKTVNVQMRLSDRIAHMATNPYITPILLTLGIVGTFMEIITPGFGLPGIIGLVAFGLFFGGSFLAGAAQSWVLSLFIIGLILLIIEMFIPGFGVFGVAGIISIIGSVMIAFPSPHEALISMGIALVASIIIIFFMVKYLVKTTVFDRIILWKKQEKTEGYIASKESNDEYLGKVGVALTPLRPAGSMLLDGKKLDVVTQGEFILDGTSIKVVRVEGNKIIVKRAEQESE